MEWMMLGRLSRTDIHGYTQSLTKSKSRHMSNVFRHAHLSVSRAASRLLACSSSFNVDRPSSCVPRERARGRRGVSRGRFGLGVSEDKTHNAR